MLRRTPPESDAVVKAHLAQHELKRNAPHEARVVEYVALDPCGNAAADEEHEVLPTGERQIPEVLQLAREGGIGLPHPRDFVEQDHRLCTLPHRIGEMGEGRLPSVGRARRPPRLQGKPLAERIKLPLVRHLAVRRKSADLDESATAS